MQMYQTPLNNGALIILVARGIAKNGTPFYYHFAQRLYAPTELDLFGPAIKPTPAPVTPAPTPVSG
jgi:hypothetical protein